MNKPTAFVALLRGINVGKAKRIAMADLRKLVEELGYGDVQTLLNSGNVVFSAPPKQGATAAARIESAIASQLGVTSRVTVISAGELAAAINNNPFTGAVAEPSRFLIAVAADTAGLRPHKALARQEWAPEMLAVDDRIAWIWCPNGVLESPAATAVNRALKDGITMRNWATMRKLHALCAAII